MEQSSATALREYKLKDIPVAGTSVNYSISLYLVTSTKVFSSLKIANWKFNRPSDEGRVAEVTEEITKTGRVQGIIALACLQDSLVCYDGNHRRLALSRVEGDFCAVVSVLWNATNDAIIEEYESINKSISVPHIYMNAREATSQETERALAISDYCGKLCDRYKVFVSPSRACKTPHFNRNVLEDDLLDLCQDYADTHTVKEVLTNLDKMNSCYKQEKHKFKKSTVKGTAAVKKCETGGLWLFSKGRRIDRTYFELVLKA